MPDLFDNFFGKISSAMNGGKSKPHYGGGTQVNTGSYYSYHQNPTNNNYWMAKSKDVESKSMEEQMAMKPRMGSVSLMESQPKSRSGSVAE